MAAKIFRYLLYALTISSFITAGYLNIYEVPEGNYGLLIERTEGLQKPLLQPGRHWLWSGFVPEKWRLITIDKAPAALDIQFQKPLRLTRHLENKELFTTTLAAQIKYRLSENAVFFFYDYFDGDFGKIEEYITKRVALLLEIKFLEFYRSDRDIPRLGALYSSYFLEENGFAAGWNEMFGTTGLELIRHDLIQVEVPELEIYRKHLQYSDAYLNARREAEIRQILADAKAHEIRITGQAELEKAEKFARLLEKYPELIEYYRIEKYSDGSKVVVVDSGQSAKEVSRQLVQPQLSQPDNAPNNSGKLPPLTRETNQAP